MNTSYILGFLRQLQANNSKLWMDQHREQYQEARQCFTELVAYAIDELQQLDATLYGVKPQECLFRINKNDFSKKGEAPYKGRMGAGISEGGRHSPYANYILVLEPGGRSRIGGGMANPTPAQLALVREEIDYNPGELEAILLAPDFKAQFGTLQGDKMQGTPKGYSKSHTALGLLQHKQYLALHYFTDEEICNLSFLKQLKPLYTTVKPLHDFLNRTVE
ncbi:DUF2461 domain-containing protein [Pontibacter sp. SGAir0037]|uniref:DUF2461 domain-containing protein n=1 Tax=Pontibacter sp. SGAir0037 TaxID=2571030 RepID=UPI0010CCC093|nr:DUF2461 domain-containing protein [Pontibacter sp. SGAir0037]QCR23349.1 TIGR02453 family protein [Pontibacter sp. SGAir0037]